MKALHDVALGTGYTFLAVVTIVVACVLYVSVRQYLREPRDRRDEDRRPGELVEFRLRGGAPGAPPSRPRRRAHP